VLEQKALDLGALGFCLSGAGSTLMMLVHNDNSQSIAEQMNKFISRETIDWNAVVLNTATGLRWKWYDDLQGIVRYLLFITYNNYIKLNVSLSSTIIF